MTRGDEGFPKSKRLLLRRQFLAVQRAGKRVGTPCFVTYARQNGGRPTRLGITVSKKVGKAVTRNRVKRLLREVFRRNHARLPVGLDLVMVARPMIAPWRLEPVEADLLAAINRIGPIESLRRGGGRRRRRRR